MIGSQIEVTYNDKDGPPRFDREPEVFFIDDKAGKPVGILRHIGREPVIAFGNSDGDYQMLEYVTAGDGPDLGLIVHHTDADARMGLRPRQPRRHPRPRPRRRARARAGTSSTWPRTGR